MGGSFAVCNSTNYEGKHACKSTSRAAWPRELRDSSSNSSRKTSRKGAFVGIPSAGAGSGKIAGQGDNV